MNSKVSILACILVANLIISATADKFGIVEFYTDADCTNPWLSPHINFLVFDQSDCIQISSHLSLDNVQSSSSSFQATAYDSPFC
mmetsp:Transcript_23020/g.19987  ORF Transcript_23020/g.19987 Transcript_23020/m.19987 type:complete len:85 (+) Transcript_23020:38-292(+)